MDTGNMHKKFGKDRVCGSGDVTDRQTDIFITILKYRQTFQILKAQSLFHSVH